MAKTANITTLSTLQFVPYAYQVFREDWLVIAEFMNWVACNRQQVHVSTACGETGWGGTGSPRTLRIMYPAVSTLIDAFYFKIVVPPETVTIACGAQMFMSGGQTGTAVFTVGGASPLTITRANGDNGIEGTGNVSTSSSGTGELDVRVQIQHTVGSAADCFLYSIRVEEAVIVATSLPGPADT